MTRTLELAGWVLAHLDEMLSTNERTFVPGTESSGRTIAQMLDKNFADVPDGMSPVVFVFDDASPEQFRYIENNA